MEHKGAPEAIDHICAAAKSALAALRGVASRDGAPGGHDGELLSTTHDRVHGLIDLLVRADSIDAVTRMIDPEQSQQLAVLAVHELARIDTELQASQIAEDVARLEQSRECLLELAVELATAVPHPLPGLANGFGRTPFSNEAVLRIQRNIEHKDRSRRDDDVTTSTGMRLPRTPQPVRVARNPKQNPNATRSARPVVSAPSRESHDTPLAGAILGRRRNSLLNTEGIRDPVTRARTTEHLLAHAAAADKDPVAALRHLWLAFESAMIDFAITHRLALGLGGEPATWSAADLLPELFAPPAAVVGAGAPAVDPLGEIAALAERVGALARAVRDRREFGLP